LQRISKRFQLFRIAKRINFHAPVKQISHVSVHAKACRCPLDEKAEANSLHPSGYEKLFGKRFHDNTLHAFTFADARL
jgi:hypothetical protein